MPSFVLSPDQARPWGALSIKTLNTRDGQAYTYTLTHEGAPVASVENGGTGGPTNVHWYGLRWDGTPLPAEALVHRPAAHKKAAPAAARAYVAWKALLASLPPVPSEYGGSDLTVDDSWLAEDVLNIVRIRKQIQKKILFMLPDGKEYGLSGPINEQARAWVKRKHPDAVLLNDLWADTPTPAVQVPATPAPAAPRGPMLLDLMAKITATAAKAGNP